MTAGGSERILDPGTWNGLLAFLTRDADRAGEAYELARRKLVKLFRWRGLPSPEELADEVFDRVARKLAVDAIEAPDPIRYLLGVAQNVAREVSRRVARTRPLDEQRTAEPMPAEADSVDDGASRRCFDECLAKVDDHSRKLLLEYHTGESGERIARRKTMADDMGVALNALRIRVHRLRARLEHCIRGCTARTHDLDDDGMRT